MNYTPKNIKKALRQVIDDISAKPELFAKDPLRDFTRKRKLPFKRVVESFFSMTSKSLGGELLDYFNLSPELPSVSAFVQQRNKLSNHAFENIFNHFNNATDEKKLYKGYRLLAIDGSSIQMPVNPNDTITFFGERSKKKPYNLLHLNAAFDLMQQTYTDAIVQGGKLENEHKAFISMVDRNTSNLPVIYIADRGFESYNNIAHVQEKGAFFLIRVKDVLSKNGITKGFYLPDTDEFDQKLTINLTRTQANNTAIKNQKYISHTSPFDFLPNTASREDRYACFELSFRIVRIKISENSFETLLTNLDSENFTATELKELYAMRWGIETSFRTLKYTLGLTFVHSKKSEYVIHEIFAKLTLYNFVQLITSHLVVKNGKRKYKYKINISTATAICRSFLIMRYSAASVERLIVKNILPLRALQNMPRNMQTRKIQSFIYRVA